MWHSISWFFVCVALVFGRYTVLAAGSAVLYCIRMQHCTYIICSYSICICCLHILSAVWGLSYLSFFSYSICELIFFHILSPGLLEYVYLFLKVNNFLANLCSIPPRKCNMSLPQIPSMMQYSNAWENGRITSSKCATNLCNIFSKNNIKLRLLSRTWPNISKLERTVLILRPSTFIAAVVKRLVPASLNAWKHQTASVQKGANGWRWPKPKKHWKNLQKPWKTKKIKKKNLGKPKKNQKNNFQRVLAGTPPPKSLEICIYIYWLFFCFFHFFWFSKVFAGFSKVFLVSAGFFNVFWFS